MRIPKGDERYFKLVKKGERETLSDAQTKLYIKVKQELYAVTVDRGIIRDTKPGIRKCDFLLYSEIEKVTHLIELKGTVIDEALKQLKETIQSIGVLVEEKFLIANQNCVDSYIVSPMRNKIPKGISHEERELAKTLASRCGKKPSNIMDLIHYVKVTPGQKKLSNHNRHIICSNEAPLEF